MGSKKNTIERKAMIFNVQKYNMYDGPGIRTIVFFKGCPLRCKWCSNPEGLEHRFDIMIKKSACINCGACVEVCPEGIHYISKESKEHKIDRTKTCIGCGKCKDACHYEALEIAGERKTVSELLEIIKEDETFYEMSGGGVTLGGGECTAQPEAAKTLLMASKEEGINTAIETCGYVKTEKLLEIAEYVDLFLFDIKQMDPIKHNNLTGVNNELILKNLRELLDSRFNVHVRMPMLKDINDSKEEIKAVIEFLKPYKDYENFKGIDLLPYHKLGVNKYNQLDMEYPIEGDPSLTDNELKQIESWLKEYDFPVTIVKH
ncbi:MAG: choline TMA-lyase-activating enzyme [Miniphocaeibacter sp.]|uniref:choline TMA-lyase-activating enzyme n=1 Tax=Miniphocaeibacter sp. TaxID=3100973 RepID=UPI00182DA04A|nr:choline TMA-lyase-activating enzyme [Gallicola sp.]